MEQRRRNAEGGEKNEGGSGIVGGGIQHLRYLRTEDGMVQENGNVGHNSVHSLHRGILPVDKFADGHVVNFPVEDVFPGNGNARYHGDAQNQPDRHGAYPLVPIPFFVKKQHDRQQSHFRDAAGGKRGHHRRGQNAVDQPQLPRPFPLDFVIVQIQRRDQEKLINPRLPENAEIPIFDIRIRDNGQKEIVKFKAHGVLEHRHRVSALIHADAQDVRRQHGIRPQHGHNHHIILGRIPQRKEIRQKHRRQQAQQNTEIHQLPVPLYQHGKQKHRRRNHDDNHTPVFQNLEQISPVDDQKRRAQQADHAQHEELRLLKTDYRRGEHTVPRQKKHGREKRGEGNFCPTAVREGIMGHLRFSFVICSTASSRCAAPLGTATPPNWLTTSSQAVP